MMAALYTQKPTTGPYYFLFRLILHGKEYLVAKILVFCNKQKLITSLTYAQSVIGSFIKWL